MLDCLLNFGSRAGSRWRWRKRQIDTLDGYSRKYFRLTDFDCECDHVVPWTISACNVDADLMLIAQDWASEDFLNALSEQQR